MSVALGSRRSAAAAAAMSFLLRFLTPRRVWSYPFVTFLVLVSVAAYDLLSGTGLLNGLSGGFGGDFLAFYTGGSFVRLGMPEALVSGDAQAAFQERVLGSRPDGVAVWVSPPYFAWAFAPISALAYVPAYFVFVALSAGLLYAALRAVDRELALGLGAATMMALGIQYYPSFQWLLNGQITGLWLALSTAVFLVLRRRHDFAAGLLLGCFACKPPLAMGIVAALLAAGRARTLAGAAVSTGALLALGELTLPGAMRAYLRQGSELVALVRADGYNTAGLHGSFELGTLLFDGISRPLATVTGALVALCLLGSIARWWWRVPWRPATRGWDLRMAATLALGVVASPHLFVYDLMLLLLPLFIVMAHVRAERGVPLGGGSLFGWTAIVWALGLLGPTLTVAQQTATRAVFGVSMALQIGVLAIFAWATTVVRLAREPPLTPR